jgi:hypothetical protein
MGRQ